MTKTTSTKRFLTVHLISRGFGFAVFEGSSVLIDWGGATVKTDQPTECLRRIIALVDRYRVDTVVIEDPKRSPHRCVRVRRLLKRIELAVSKRRVRTKGFSRSDVRRTFAGMGLRNKHDMAVLMAARFPELLRRLPPKRKPWMAADPRMAIFDATALAIAYSA